MGHKSKPSQQMNSSANLGVSGNSSNDPQQKKVYKFPLNNQKGSNSANNSQSRDPNEGQGSKTLPATYGSQSAQNLPKVSFGQGTKMNLLNRQSQSPQTVNNTAPNTVGSKKYVGTSSPGLGSTQGMQNSQGYNFKQKANSPNNYASQGG